MPIRLTSVVTAAALVAAGLSAGATASELSKHREVAQPAGKRVYFPSRCGNSKIRPQTIVVACGDAGFIIESISWSRWGQGSAEGSGIGVTKKCVPDCASGGIEKNPVAVRLSRVTGCKDNGRLQYTRLSYDFGSKGPSSGAHSGSVRFPCNI